MISVKLRIVDKHLFLDTDAMEWKTKAAVMKPTDTTTVSLFETSGPAPSI